MNNIKKEVKEKIHQYYNRKYLDDYINSEYITSNGDANIFIKLKSKEELFDPRTYKHQKELDSSIYSFLDKKAAILDNDVQVNFYILGVALTEKEMESVKLLLEEHYAFELHKAQKEYKRCVSKIVKLIILGLLSLGICGLTSLFMYNSIIYEVLIFIASLTIWEAFDCYIYDLSDIKKEREAVTQKLLIDVYFDVEEGND